VNILSRGANKASPSRAEEIKIEEEKEAVVFRCPFCQEQFDTLANLERHKNRNHLGVTPKECGFCVQETNVFGSQEHHFYGDVDLFCHVVEKHRHRLKKPAAQKAAGIFLCPRCDQAFCKKLAFHVHVFEAHENDGPLRCKNSGCSLGFWSKMDLDQHNCEHKPAGLKIRVISDAKCDDNEESGYEDILYDQRDKDVNKVKIKEYNTRLEFNIRTRAMDVHTNHSHFTTNFKSFKAENFECCECGSQFDSPEGLTTHLDQHEWAEKGAPLTTDPVSNCVMCSFSVDSDLTASDKYRQMADHVISAHFNASWPTLNPPQMPPPFHRRQKHDLIKQPDETGEEVSDQTKLRSVCEACFKEFETEAMLRIHMKYAHGTNSKMAKQLGQLNKCKKCNKTCTSESQLSLHTSLYCDVSYSCDFCPAVFDQIKVLAVHVKAVHKGETVLVESSQQRPRDQPQPQVTFPCPYSNTDNCFASFNDRNSKAYSDHVTQHHIDHMQEHHERQKPKSWSIKKRDERLKRKAQQELDDEMDEMLPVAAPLSTNSPFMVDEVDGEQENTEPMT